MAGSTLLQVADSGRQSDPLVEGEHDPGLRRQVAHALAKAREVILDLRAKVPDEAVDLVELAAGGLVLGRRRRTLDGEETDLP